MFAVLILAPAVFLSELEKLKSLMKNHALDIVTLILRPLHQTPEPRFHNSYERLSMCANG